MSFTQSLIRRWRGFVSRIQYFCIASDALRAVSVWESYVCVREIDRKFLLFVLNVLADGVKND